MSFVQDFEMKVGIVKGRLPRDMRDWFAEKGYPVEEEGDRAIIASGPGWYARCPEWVENGDNYLIFRIKDKGLAVMFKLTWAAL